jgi:hypothetical protein
VATLGPRVQPPRASDRVAWPSASRPART